MVVQYNKNAGIKLSEHFTSDDFDCNCDREECNLTLISSVLVQSLEDYWRAAGPFEINSGYRCEAHNAEVGGTAGSQHPKGNAADCESIMGKDGAEMASLAESVPAFKKGGIGTYKDFAHVDVRGQKSRWDFSAKSTPVIG